MTDKENVIPMFKKGKNTPKTRQATTPENDGALEEGVPAKQAKESKGMSFSDIMKRNAENKDRLKKERLKANQKVIRTHRLKH